MRLRTSIALVLLVAFAAGFGWAQDHKALTNKDITDMVKQGLNDSVIVKVIQASDTNFDTSPDAMTQMQSAGASVQVMGAMLKAASSKKKAAETTTPAPVSRAPATAPASKPIADAHEGEYLLKEGTVVPLKFATDISSRYSSEGDKVQLTLVSDLKVGDVVVVKQGAKAIAVVTHAKKAGLLPGSNGELSIQVREMVSGENRIHLRGAGQRDGVMGPIGYVTHGNIEVDEGTPLTAFVDEDIWLPPAK